MANTKLTLSIENSTVEKAKKYALEHHTSVSKLFSELINKVTEKEESKGDPFLEKLKQIKISDDVMALTGILKGKVADDVNIWDAKYEYLKEKYDL